MEDVHITGLDRVRDPQPTIKGHLILAYFTADIGGLTVKGCALVRQANGKLATWLPNMNDPKAKTLRSINFNNEQTRNSLLQHALQTFRKLGGDESDVRMANLHTMQPPPTRTVIEVKRRTLTGSENQADEEDREGLATFLGSKDHA